MKLSSSEDSARRWLVLDRKFVTTVLSFQNIGSNRKKTLDDPNILTYHRRLVGLQKHLGGWEVVRNAIAQPTER